MSDHSNSSSTFSSLDNLFPASQSPLFNVDSTNPRSLHRQNHNTSFKDSNVQDPINSYSTIATFDNFTTSSFGQTYSTDHSQMQQPPSVQYTPASSLSLDFHEQVEAPNPYEVSKPRRNTFQQDALSFEMYSIDAPQAYDVLFGRGKPFQQNPGNIRMLSIIETHKERYQKASKLVKLSIAKEVVAYIRDFHPPVRFLKQPGKLQQGKKGSVAAPWYEATEDEALKKVAHGLRSKQTSRLLMNLSIENDQKMPSAPTRNIGAPTWDNKLREAQATARPGPTSVASQVDKIVAVSKPLNNYDTIHDQSDIPYFKIAPHETSQDGLIKAGQAKDANNLTRQVDVHRYSLGTHFGAAAGQPMTGLDYLRASRPEAPQPKKELHK